jgi:nucleoside diphosphate kinase
MHPLHLGIDPDSAKATCSACKPYIRELLSGDPVYPGWSAPIPCDCFGQWSAGMRTPEDEGQFPSLRFCNCLIKPNADSNRIISVLNASYEIVAAKNITLTVPDIRRMYPESFEALYLPVHNGYLTSSESVVVLMCAKNETTDHRHEKMRIRGLLSGGDCVRNHLHMPDNPGDTIADLLHLSPELDQRSLVHSSDVASAERRVALYKSIMSAMRKA